MLLCFQLQFENVCHMRIPYHRANVYHTYVLRSVVRARTCYGEVSDVLRLLLLALSRALHRCLRNQHITAPYWFACGRVER